MTLSYANIWLAVGSITVYHVCFALLVLCISRNALVARFMAALAVTGQAYVVYLNAVVPLGPAHRRAPPLGILLVHWLSLADSPHKTPAAEFPGTALMRPAMAIASAKPTPALQTTTPTPPLPSPRDRGSGRHSR
ncbi:hypothetical protein NLG97_g5441 [Lecanicillium saksenae]|uniref:Uncharacterized protein n=1 Tax=Lecanicillium saksenae TaxID=468837 RepID=A0ACC1QSG4_9HYPO|nr:hypothetical protein NLG97_g5441 [Lecanicillium saksenae]